MQPILAADPQSLPKLRTFLPLRPCEVPEAEVPLLAVGEIAGPMEPLARADEWVARTSRAMAVFTPA